MQSSFYPEKVLKKLGQRNNPCVHHREMALETEAKLVKHQAEMSDLGMQLLHSSWPVRLRNRKLGSGNSSC